MRRATPSRRTCNAAACLVALALLVPSVGAAAIAFDGSPATHVEVRPTSSGGEFTFRVPFVVDGDREAYLKVLPSPTNPAFASGTPESGWWTVVSLLEGERVLRSEGTNGTRHVDLGRLAANATYTLQLDVRSPPGALAGVGEHRLRYVLAVKAQDGHGSGGQMDPSVPVSPRIVVSETAELALADPEEPGSPAVALVAVALAAAALAAGVGVVIHHKQRKTE